MRNVRRTLIALALLSLLGVGSPAAAQPPAAATPTTAVLTTLTVKADVPRDRITAVLPDEVRETVKLYLDGKIQQWFARSDGRGVVFILNCTTVAEAKAITDTLPLSKAKLADFEYMAIGPLTPLRLLVAPQQ
jgi:hypothetical protein